LCIGDKSMLCLLGLLLRSKEVSRPFMNHRTPFPMFSLSLVHFAVSFLSSTILFPISVNDSFSSSTDAIRVSTLKKKHFDIFRPQWIIDCVQNNFLLPYEPE